MHGLLLALCCLVHGRVVTPSGAPIARATLVFSGAKRVVTHTDDAGSVTLTLAPGRYDLTVTAQGFATVTVNTGDITANSHVDVVLEPANSPKLRTIGQVTVNGGFTLTRDVVPTDDVSRANMDALGYSSALSALQQVPSVVVGRPDGGAPTTPAVVSLRGPDPSETLVTLDGQALNDGNTGDIDLSQFAVPVFSSVNVTEGLGPSDSEGSNTFGGAVNFVSLRPTQQPHLNLSGALGSYGTSSAWINATGTVGKLGYALAGSDLQQAGLTDQYALIYPENNVIPKNCGPVVPPHQARQNCPATMHLGSTIGARLGDANLEYHFSQRANAGIRVFTLGDARDESSALDGIAGNRYEPCAPNAAHCPNGFNRIVNPIFLQHVGSGEANFAQSIRAYDGYAQSVLGAGSLIADVFASDNNVAFSGGTFSPYDVSHRDTRYNEALSWKRSYEDGEFAVGGYTQQEALNGVGIAGSLAQTLSSYFVRGARELSKRFRLSAGLYSAYYSTFGNSWNWRLGGSYDLSSSTALHASVGTGFRAPLLIERYFFAPVVVDGKTEPNPGLPPPDANCVVTGQGNPNERPEHATEYELGYSQLLSGQASLNASVYRSNLRDTIENYYPLGNFCHNPQYPQGFAYSYPINIGNAVYEGAELRFKQRFPAQHLLLNLAYGLNVAYPYDLGSNVSNPTSGGTLVAYQQFLSVPQQQGSATLNWAQGQWHAAAAATFVGRNNPLNQPPYTLVDASVGKSFGRLDLTFAATNVFNAVSGPFTYYLAGTPYRGLLGPNDAPYVANLPTDRSFVQPAAARLILTLHE
ncbi:MAG TPA: TonB-dependent receptor [Candidatus Baltobacteraceae bacterium]|nr:TonB-dependent receptor [Candidatus Baltobacteraceae bacterium]